MTRRRSTWLPPLFTLLGLAAVVIPSTQAQEPAKDEEPGYLGVIAEDQQTGGRGVRILKVLPGSPAEAGGLKVADLVTSINGQQVRDMKGVGEAIVGSHAGDTLKFEVVRNDKTETATVVLGRRPPPSERRFPQFGEILDDPSAPSGVSGEGPQLWLGVRVANMTPEVRRRLNRPGLSGALVTEVIDSSPASEAGLVVGAVIITLDNKRITGSRDLINVVHGATANAAHTIDFYAPSGTLMRKNVALRFRGAPPSELPPEASAPPEPDSLVLPPPIPMPNPVAADPLDSLNQRVGRIEAQLTEIQRLLRALVPAEKAEPPATEPSPEEPDELPEP